jgi:hypothetical protein
VPTPLATFKASCRRIGAPLAFWTLLLLVLITPFQIHRWRQAARPNDTSQHTLNVAAAVLARWQDNGLVAFSRTPTGVTVDLSQAAPEWSALTRPEREAVWTLCRQITWRGSPVTRCVIHDASGRLLMDESTAPEN